MRVSRNGQKNVTKVKSAKASGSSSGDIAPAPNVRDLKEVEGRTAKFRPFFATKGDKWGQGQ